MNALAHRRFLRMNGLGNEITVLDLRGTKTVVTAGEARAIAAASGMHFDQLMVLHDPRTPGTDAFVRIYNTDGSEAGACGNGTRCVAWAMMADPQMGDPAKKTLTLETKGGLLPARRLSDLVFTVDMGEPRLTWDEIPLAEPFHDTSGFELQIGPIDAPVLHTPGAVNMGNPHAVFFVDDPYRFNLEQIGPLLENHPIFPDRANIGLAAVKAPDHIVLRVWERGAGITRACGSGACAALVAAVRRELSDRKATVSLPGGDLVIEWRESDGHVLMTGPVELEREGVLEPALFAA
ncbi:diaminopimelate epimerase [Bosea sp. (in: a-proteobacteria)]|jgi:diaminopimelate epimerase|uniref:diaminopimelate epimerase n=1 Tax=Bosea sp. (in: a-proteobacteria) TaxID=1871050 RepID=UPI00086F9352|nr:diaminopimelate epimerase [Bosea sp. (in: a-proteobacteria)]MBN9438688.1 diaminopimelate epimerase [Bosea sp. (in: a-proteobacteria)]ODT44343.1 MAG: diaminopimelate epimerase [Methylobacterium sp. SCN 67-24]